MAQLPPLNALKSFKSAARTGSYVAAAAELNVTPAAISQQVRTLEAFLKRKLFTRYNNRIVLTDAGQAYFAAVTPSLDDIATVTSRVMTGNTRSKLVVSVVPSLAESWFMPAFEAFAKETPRLRIDLRIEEAMPDFTVAGIDLRLCYGGKNEGAQITEPLFRDEVLPLCSPALAQDVSCETADDSLLIHTAWGESYGSHPGWTEWLARYMPSRRVDARKGHHAGSSFLALEFARRGLGIALGQRALAREMIQKNQLVALHDGTLPLGQDYCAVYPLARAKAPGLRELLAFLKTQAQHP
ncbi:LysR substrate-binding domain-containing protein [Aestuariivirga sp.]|uniref:LysR substrate-binding domain-containing protein n=1 Tax=Aestuariivirga sp. TaxID=2650926 RepID=UPI0039E3ABBD